VIRTRAARRHRGRASYRRRARASRRESVPADQGDKPRARDRPDAVEDAVPLPEQDDLLVAAAAERLDEASALGELRDERRRHAREGRGDEDRVVRACSGTPSLPSPTSTSTLAAPERTRCIRALTARSSQRSMLQTWAASRARSALCQPQPVPISSTRSQPVRSASTMAATSEGCVVTPVWMDRAFTAGRSTVPLWSIRSVMPQGSTDFPHAIDRAAERS
jgi:hypothetical protein